MSDTQTPSTTTDSAATLILKPPVSFRVAQAIVGAELTTLIAWFLSCLPSRDCTVPRYWCALFCIAALIGLVRRVKWGLLFVTLAGLLACLGALVAAIPWPDDPEEERGLTFLFGTLPPVWVSIMAVIITCTLLLLPLIILSKRKDYFRSRLW